MPIKSPAPPVILYQDGHCLAVVKPAGMLTQGRPQGEQSLEGWLRRRICPREPASVYLAAIHRLDRPVSGVMVWGKTPKAARRLHQQFADRTARKEYWAIVEGRPEPAEAVWNDWLFEENTGLGPTVQVCRPEAPRSRQAITRMTVEAVGPPRLAEGIAWLRLWPRTGRTHQLRVQAAWRGHPILGDRAYGSDQPFPIGIGLHAWSLTLVHPMLRTPMTWTAAPTPAWAEAGIGLPEV